MTCIHKGYLYINGKYEHKRVYEDSHGVIPKAYHIHHIDGDKTNNNIRNLQLLTPSEHGKITRILNYGRCPFQIKSQYERNWLACRKPSPNFSNIRSHYYWWIKT